MQDVTWEGLRKRLARALHFSLPAGRQTPTREGKEASGYLTRLPKTWSGLTPPNQVRATQITTTTTLLHKSSKRPTPCPTTGGFFVGVEIEEALNRRAA